MSAGHFLEDFGSVPDVAVTRLPLRDKVFVPTPRIDRRRAQAAYEPFLPAPLLKFSSSRIRDASWFRVLASGAYFRPMRPDFSDAEVSMRFKRLFAAVAAIAAIVASGAAGSSTAHATTTVIKITVWNGSGAAIGLINPADSQHTTRATALSIPPWGEATDIWVPTDGTFVVIYAETCLRVPGSLNGFNFVGGRYNVQLGAVWLTPTLNFVQDKSNPTNGVYVVQNSTASSCSGL
ncbi:hypothetical protein ERC79_00865 [Rhodococcus sp. ABRD24]|uniref:hypothetical protein n=1 Tax=Rhodococcus sp. ABRD24 TaxID=2507582 RepID=UPI00103F4413|nr:hypothetical protein [Rhodococcus sp. ABRD24]QBJ94679.1 hypothetical protein ERC79_00865 [Rhodococcus sp. ABRD24]